MASSSVSQEDHEIEHDSFAMASRRAKVRSARVLNSSKSRTVNTTFPLKGDEDRDIEGGESNIPKYEQTNVVLVEQNNPDPCSPKPLCRALNKQENKRSVARGAHAGKSNKGVRDRRKLREKRRSTGLMHLPSTESTGGSTGEDENNENSVPTIPKASIVGEVEEKVANTSNKQGKSESDLDADDEANNSDVRVINREDSIVCHLKTDNEKLTGILQTKEKRIAALEMQVSHLTRQLSEMREENAKLLRAMQSQKP